MKAIERPGGRTLAAEAAGAGRPVVLLHAGIADRRMWDDVVPALAAEHLVVRYDLAGYGDSPFGGAPISHTGDLAAVLAAFAVGHAALVGASLGGRVALEFALEQPRRVDGLLLVAPGLRGHAWSPALAGARDDQQAAFERGDLAAAADVMVRVWVVGPTRSEDAVDPGVPRRVRAMTVRSYEHYAHALAAGLEPEEVEARDPPASARLGEIDAPTLVLVGDADVPDMLQIADRLEAGIPSARKVVWPGVAHVPPLERPHEFARLALDFLAALPDSAARSD